MKRVHLCDMGVPAEVWVASHSHQHQPRNAFSMTASLFLSVISRFKNAGLSVLSSSVVSS